MANNNTSTQKLVNELEKSVQVSKALLTLHKELQQTVKVSAENLKKGFGSVKTDSSKGLTDFNNKIKETNKLTQENETLTKQEIKLQKQLVTNTEKLKNARSKENIEIQKQKILITEANRVSKQKAKESLKLVGAYERESRRLNDLRKKYKNLAVQGKENTKVGQKWLQQITRLDKKLKAIDKTVGQSQREVGSYTDSFKEALSVTGLFGREIALLQGVLKVAKGVLSTTTAKVNTNTVATAENTVSKQANAAATGVLATAQRAYNLVLGASTKALKVFKIALASTGVGALVIALGSLITFFTQTQKGAELLERGLTGLTTTLDVITDRFSDIGEALIDIFTGDFEEGAKKMSKAFKGIGEEISIEVGEMDKITKSLQLLDKQTSMFIITRARLRKDISELRLFGETETNDINLRIEALQLAFEKEEEIANERIRIAKEQVFADITGGESAKTRIEAEEFLSEVLAGNSKLTIDNLGFAKSNAEDLAETSGKIAEILNAQAEQFKRQKGEQAKINSLMKERDKGGAKELGILQKINKEISKLRQQRSESKTEESIESLTIKIKELEVEQKRLNSLGKEEIKSKNQIIGLINIENQKLRELKKARSESLTKEDIKRLSDEIDLQEKKVEAISAIASAREREANALKEIEKFDKEQELQKIEQDEATVKNINKRAEKELELIEIKRKQELEDENLTASQKELINKRYNAQIEDVEKKRIDDIKSLEIKAAEDTAKTKLQLAEKGIKIFDTILSKAREKQNEETDKELDVLDTRIDTVRTAIENGNEGASDSLAELEKQKIEAEQKKEEIRKKEIRDEMLIAGLQAFASNDGNVGKTLGDVSLLIAALNTLPSFFDGTEDTGTVQKPLDSNGGRTAILHDNERVLTAKQNAPILKAGLSNEDVSDLVKMHGNGSLGGTTVVANNNKELISEVREMTKAVRSIPIQSYNYDSKGKYHEQVIQSNNKKETIKVRVNNLFK